MSKVLNGYTQHSAHTVQATYLLDTHPAEESVMAYIAIEVVLATQSGKLDITAEQLAFKLSEGLVWRALGAVRTLKGAS